MTAPGPTTLNYPIVPDRPRPDRNSAVSVYADASVSVNIYIDAMTDTPAGVHSAPCISHGRVAVYFGSRQAALIAVQEGLSYKGSYLELTPLVQPTVRITLSNVYTEIPNSVLIQHLSSFCKVVSQVKPIPLGCKKERKHTHLVVQKTGSCAYAPERHTPEYYNLHVLGEKPPRVHIHRYYREMFQVWRTEAYFPPL